MREEGDTPCNHPEIIGMITLYRSICYFYLSNSYPHHFLQLPGNPSPNQLILSNTINWTKFTEATGLKSTLSFAAAVTGLPSLLHRERSFSSPRALLCPHPSPSPCWVSPGCRRQDTGLRRDSTTSMMVALGRDLISSVPSIVKWLR